MSLIIDNIKIANNIQYIICLLPCRQSWFDMRDFVSRQKKICLCNYHEMLLSLSYWAFYNVTREGIPNRNKVYNNTLSWNLLNYLVSFFIFSQFTAVSHVCIGMLWVLLKMSADINSWLTWSGGGSWGTLHHLCDTNRVGGHNLLGCVTNLDNKRLKKKTVLCRGRGQVYGTWNFFCRWF